MEKKLQGFFWHFSISLYESNAERSGAAGILK